MGFGLDLEQEMGQWSLMLRSGTLTSVITSGLFVYIFIVNTSGRRLCNSSRCFHKLGLA